MIKSIRLENFMSHKNSHILLGKRLNVIIGKNDVGKSAILHAIRWFLINEPRGTDFITIGERVTRVSIEVEDAVLVKQRTAAGTQFMIESFGEVIDTYHKSEIPEEFLDILEINVVTKFGNFSAELNFIFQHDSYFMISDSGSSGAQVLGKIAGTDPIDYASKKLKKESFGINNILKVKNSEKEEIEEVLLDYEHLEAAREQYEALVKEVKELNVKREKGLKLVQLDHDYKEPASKIENVSKELDAYKILKAVDYQLNLLSYEISKYSKINTAKLLFDDKVKEVRELGIKLFQLSGLSDLEKNLDVTSLKSIKRKNLYKIYTDFVSTSKAIFEDQKAYEFYGDLEYLADKLASTSTLNKTMRGYISIKYKYLENFEEKAAVEAKLKDYDTDVNAKLKNLENFFDSSEKLKDINSSYQSALSCINLSNNMIKEAENIINEETKNIDNLFSELEVCPLCEQELPY